MNLVLAIERLGDEKLDAGDQAPAAALFEEALAAVAAAPEGCFSDGLPAGTGERLAGAEARLQDKLASTRQEQDQEPAPETGQEESQGEDTQDSARQSKLEQLEDSARQAQRERNSGREREQYLDDTGGSAGTDRPW